MFRTPEADICHPRTGTIRDWLVLRHRYWQKRDRERRLLNLRRQRPTPCHHRQPDDIRLSWVRTHAGGSCQSPRRRKNQPFGRQRLSRVCREKRRPFQRGLDLTWSRNQPQPQQDQPVPLFAAAWFQLRRVSAWPILLHVFRDRKGLRRLRVLRHKAQGNQKHAGKGAHNRGMIIHFGRVSTICIIEEPG